MAQPAVFYPFPGVECRAPLVLQGNHMDESVRTVRRKTAADSDVGLVFQSVPAIN